MFVVSCKQVKLCSASWLPYLQLTVFCVTGHGVSESFAVSVGFVDMFVDVRLCLCTYFSTSQYTS